jgi:hypothetical protein
MRQNCPGEFCLCRRGGASGEKLIKSRPGREEFVWRHARVYFLVAGIISRQAERERSQGGKHREGRGWLVGRVVGCVRRKSREPRARQRHRNTKQLLDLWARKTHIIW